MTRAKYIFQAFITILFVCSCNEEYINTSSIEVSHITNGEKNASFGEFSWLVKIDTCAGVIIDKRFILTVAHCVYDKWPSLVIMRAGHNGAINQLEYLSKAKKIILHPNYVPFSESSIKENDIALIELKEDIIFTDKLNKIELPIDVIAEEGQNYILGAYGRDELKKYPKELNFLKGLTLLASSNSNYWNDNNHHDILKSDDDEQDFLGTYFTGQYLAVKVSQRKSACRGDSGAPLVDEKANVVVGLVSHGSNNCMEQKAFFLTKVSNYIEWIKKEISYEGN